MEKQRLDKFLSNQLNISRSEARTAIKHGCAEVNGGRVKDVATVVKAGEDLVSFNGQPIIYKKCLYILMNKPKGVLSASNDRLRQTVIDLVPEKLKRPNLAPVGRLDKDTTGLLLITDDGNFAHNIISPKKGIPKSYIALLDGDITEETVTKFAEGVTLADGTLCKKAKLERLDKNKARLVLTEGKYHEVKRMFGTVGIGVVELHRESIGFLKIPEDLAFGECVEIDEKTAKSLQNL